MPSFPDAQPHRINYGEEVKKANGQWLRNPSLKGVFHPIQKRESTTPSGPPHARLHPLSPPDDYIQCEADIAKIRLETATELAVEIMDSLDQEAFRTVVSALALCEDVTAVIQKCHEVIQGYPGGMEKFVLHCTYISKKMNDAAAQLRLKVGDHCANQSTISTLLKTRISRKDKSSAAKTRLTDEAMAKNLRILADDFSRFGFASLTQLSDQTSVGDQPGCKTIPSFIPNTYHHHPWSDTENVAHIKLTNTQHTINSPASFPKKIAASKKSGRLNAKQKKEDEKKRAYTCFVTVGKIIQQPPSNAAGRKLGDLHIHLSSGRKKLSIWQVVSLNELHTWITVTDDYLANEGTYRHPLFPDSVLHCRFTGYPSYILETTQKSYTSQEKSSRKNVVAFLQGSASRAGSSASANVSAEEDGEDSAMEEDDDDEMY
ncbi:hypothetical protein BJ165DRAFT_1533497 [Panaeolus papilionaceus]|nr:hypothetical protein BJ165DRAFT_1533497 [Panaeolus papilionaceus]